MSAAGTVLILGGAGRLGQALIARCALEGRAWVAPSAAEVDLRRPETLDRSLDAIRPVRVVNAAAFTDVARCEDPALRSEVYAVNAEGPGALARACAVRGVHLVHVSTDYVFDGEKRSPYLESDPPRPLQVYGASKLEGERAVLEAFPASLVVRVSTLFGPPHPPAPAYVDHILRQARAGNRLELVETPVASPTYAPDAAEAILSLCDSSAEGIVHLVNAGSCSRLELARAVLEAAGLADRCTITTRPEPEGGLRRPPYSVLDDGKLRDFLCHRLRTWQEAVRDYVDATARIPS